MRSASPSTRRIVISNASQRWAALLAISANARRRSIGELEITHQSGLPPDRRWRGDRRHRHATSRPACSPSGGSNCSRPSPTRPLSPSRTFPCSKKCKRGHGSLSRLSKISNSPAQELGPVFSPYQFECTREAFARPNGYERPRGVIDALWPEEDFTPVAHGLFLKLWKTSSGSDGFGWLLAFTGTCTPPD